MCDKLVCICGKVNKTLSQQNFKDRKCSGKAEVSGSYEIGNIFLIKKILLNCSFMLSMKVDFYIFIEHIFIKQQYLWLFHF